VQGHEIPLRVEFVVDVEDGGPVAPLLGVVGEGVLVGGEEDRLLLLLPLLVEVDRVDDVPALEV
jgi:hypothetical protein